MSHSWLKAIIFFHSDFVWPEPPDPVVIFTWRECGFELDVTGLLGGGWFLQSAQKARWKLSCREQNWDEWAAVWDSRKHCERVWNQKIIWLPFPEQKVKCSGLHSGQSWEERFCWRKIKQHQEWENELCKGCASVTQMPYLWTRAFLVVADAE